MAAFAKRLGVAKLDALSGELPADRRPAFDPALRQQQLVREMENQVQTLVRLSRASSGRSTPLI